MGIAWLVIVAAEMLVGGTGIGYFVWNEWNNLALANVIFAILVIGLVGMVLDLLFARAQKAVVVLSIDGAVPGPPRRRPISCASKASPSVRASAAEPVFENVNFAIDRGEFVCIVGHSGCGKTTILNVLAGLEQASAGHVFMDGREVAGPEPRARRGLPGPRADAVADGARQHRLRGARALARLDRGRRCDAHVRRSSSTWSASPAPSDKKPAAALGRHEAARRASRAPSRSSRRCCCSTSRSARSTRSRAARSRTSCCASAPRRTRRCS